MCSPPSELSMVPIESRCDDVPYLSPPKSTTNMWLQKYGLTKDDYNVLQKDGQSHKYCLVSFQTLVGITTHHTCPFLMTKQQLGHTTESYQVYHLQRSKSMTLGLLDYIRLIRLD